MSNGTAHAGILVYLLTVLTAFLLGLWAADNTGLLPSRLHRDAEATSFGHVQDQLVREVTEAQEKLDKLQSELSNVRSDASAVKETMELLQKKLSDDLREVQESVRDNFELISQVCVGVRHLVGPAAFQQLVEARTRAQEAKFRAANEAFFTKFPELSELFGPPPPLLYPVGCSQ